MHKKMHTKENWFFFSVSRCSSTFFIRVSVSAELLLPAMHLNGLLTFNKNYMQSITANNRVVLTPGLAGPFTDTSQHINFIFSFFFTATF